LANAKTTKTEVETNDQKKARYTQPNEQFYWLGLITTKGQYRNVQEVDENYMPFMVNKGLSYYPDTIGLVDMMNQNSHLSNKMQYDFLYHLVPKGKRFEKWIKPENEEMIKQLQELYKVSRPAAREYLKTIDCLSNKEEIIIEISEKLNRGGRC
jgi:hypothetical protein